MRDEEFDPAVLDRLPAHLLRPLTQLSSLRATLAVMRTLLPLAAILWFALTHWSAWAIIPAVVLIGMLQHALFILAHDAAHYRLYETRWLNDLVGRLLGAIGGISMRTYRVLHRLHHNHLYGPQDPDVALHGGYPRGQRYLLKKLAKDLCGFTAWKNYAYFFGHPAINADGGSSLRPLDDTSPALRAQARQDRWFVVLLQACMALTAWRCGILLEYGVLWLLPLITVLQAMLRFRAICEHGAVSDTTSVLHAARTNYAPWIVREMLFPHHVNYHLEHHLYPAVPHYRLPELHRVLAQRGMLRNAEVRSVQQTLQRVFGAL